MSQQNTQLVDYSIYPNTETWLIHEFIRENNIPNLDHTRHLINHNHNNILAKLATNTLKEIKWDWLAERITKGDG